MWVQQHTFLELKSSVAVEIQAYVKRLMELLFLLEQKFSLSSENIFAFLVGMQLQ
jgi:hypothetical protein